jgi:hypothetical protein
VKIRLWKNDDEGSPPLWLCEWAMSPIRVAIGLGDREKVPGVKSGRIPVKLAEEAEAPRTLAEGDWPPVALEDTSASADSELPTDVTADERGMAAERAIGVAAASLDAAGAVVSDRAEGEMPAGSDDAAPAASVEKIAESTAGAFPAMPGDAPAPRRSKRRHRRRR